MESGERRNTNRNTTMNKKFRMIKKIIIGILSALGLFYISFTIFFSVFSDCYTMRKGLVTSPDGEYVAEYYQEVCEDEPSEIKIWLGKQKSDTRTLIFSSIATTTEKIEMSWPGERELRITYPGALNPTNTNSSVDDINITFKLSK